MGSVKRRSVLTWKWVFFIFPPILQEMGKNSGKIYAQKSFSYQMSPSDPKFFDYTARAGLKNTDQTLMY